VPAPWPRSSSGSTPSASRKRCQHASSPFPARTSGPSPSSCCRRGWPPGKAPARPRPRRTRCSRLSSFRAPRRLQPSVRSRRPVRRLLLLQGRVHNRRRPSPSPRRNSPLRPGARRAPARLKRPRARPGRSRNRSARRAGRRGESPPGEPRGGAPFTHRRKLLPPRRRALRVDGTRRRSMTPSPLKPARLRSRRRRPRAVERPPLRRPVRPTIPAAATGRATASSRTCVARGLL
jgi:hypothetical protein